MIADQYATQAGGMYFLARPEARKDESPGSWIQRLSGAHQYSLSQISSFSKVFPKQFDWDANVSNQEWLSLLKLADADESFCGEARFAINALRYRMPRRSHLYRAHARPCYRWCPSCFSGDSVPYLRWHWRMAACTYCDVHKCRLEEKCRWCSSPLSLHRALLVGGGRSRNITDLSICGSCGMPLGDELDAAEDKFGLVYENDDISSLFSKIREAYLSDDAQFEFDFTNYNSALNKPVKRPIPTIEASEAIWVDLCINRITEPLRPSFMLNAQSFDEITNTLAAQVRRPRWTDGIRPRDRLRLATALRIIRNEKRAHIATKKPGSS